MVTLQNKDGTAKARAKGSRGWAVVCCQITTGQAIDSKIHTQGDKGWKPRGSYREDPAPDGTQGAERPIMRSLIAYKWA